MLDANSVCCAEAAGGDTLIRHRSARPIRDVGAFGEMEGTSKGHWLVPIHDNPHRIVKKSALDILPCQAVCRTIQYA